MRIIDISRTLAPGRPGWPGDTPYRFDLAATKADGSSVNVGRLTTSTHIGTHVDAPFHVDDAGRTIEALPLDPYLGPARVVDVRGRDHIAVADLARVDLAGTPRLLLRTGGWPDPTVFPGSIPTLDPDVPAWLADRGVVLVGLDVPSVDAIDSKDLPIHHALGRVSILILESLDLDQVEPGTYDLIALPLKIEGGDGSPVRAVLLAGR